MGFDLLDINKFIKEKDAKEVTSEKTFLFTKGDFIPDPNGLYSPQIFEGTGIKGQRDKYGYISLKNTIMHPLIYKNLKKIATIFYYVATSEKHVEIIDGELIETPPENGGKTGLDFLINNWKKINLDKYKKETNEFFIEFLKKVQEKLIFINKLPVIPVLYRPYTFEHGRVIEDEITEKYKKILLEYKKTMGGLSGQPLNSLNSKNLTASEDAVSLTGRRSTISNIDNPLGISDDNGLELLNSFIQNNVNSSEKVQKYVQDLYDYFISKLEKKEGFFRSNLVGKRLDNVSRLVANARPDIPVDCVGIPWHVLINIFDYYVLAELEHNKDVAEKLGLADISTVDFGKHIYYIYKNCDIYCKSFPERQQIWIELLTEIFDKHDYLRVVFKRDPGWSANSFWSVKPLILKGCSYYIVVNSFYYKPLGGDSFNTNILIKESTQKSITKDLILSKDPKKIQKRYTLEFPVANEAKTLKNYYEKNKKEK